jgi:hypothetical protein
MCVDHSKLYYCTIHRLIENSTNEHITYSPKESSHGKVTFMYCHCTIKKVDSFNKDMMKRRAVCSYSAIASFNRPPSTSQEKKPSYG